MKTFFVLIFISFKLIAFPIGNGKAMFSLDTKTPIVKEFQNAVNIASFDEELNETEESENDSKHTIVEKSSFRIHDFFSSLLTLSNSPIWAYSSQPHSCQQLYRLFLNFRL